MNEVIPHILQSATWARVRQTQGHKPVRVGNTLMTVKPLPSPFPAFGYIPQGDISKIDWILLAQTSRLLGLSHILVDPVNPRDGVPMEAIDERLKAVGLSREKSPGLYYRQTTRLNLTPDEETLKAQMKKKTRYNLKLSQEKGIKVEIRDDEKALEAAVSLILETGRRQKYFARDGEYYRSIYKTMKEGGAEDVQIKIAIASYQNEPLVAWILYADPATKTIYYPYGGSSEKLREFMPAYSLVWEIILWGKQNGYEYFDLWGTNEDNPEEGFTRFKLGWGGEVITYEQSFDVVVRPFWFKLFKIGNSLRWLALRAKKAILR